MILLLLGVSVRWTKPINPSVDETPDNRLTTTPSGWRNLATNSFATAIKEYKIEQENKKNMNVTTLCLPSCRLEFDEATTSRCQQQLISKPAEGSSHEASETQSSAKLKSQSREEEQLPSFVYCRGLISCTCEEDKEESRNLAVESQRLSLDRSCSILIGPGGP